MYYLIFLLADYEKLRQNLTKRQQNNKKRKTIYFSQRKKRRTSVIVLQHLRSSINFQGTSKHYLDKEKQKHHW